MENNANYTEVIKGAYNQITEMIKGSEWENDEKVIQVLSIFQKAVYYQIHRVLAPQKTKEAEQEIRDIIKNYVIGCVKKTKIANLGVIPMLKAKMETLKKKKNIVLEHLQKYIELYSDFMAIAAFRNYKYFCFLMQSCFNFTLWQDNVRAFEGYWFYTEKMILDGKVKFIEKQLPTGTGKSLSDCFAHAWTFGIDINADIFKVCGNDKFTDDCFNNVVKIMTSPLYAKVFPYYAQFNCDKNLMYTFCSVKELKFCIQGATKSTSLRIVTKYSDSSGVRAKYLYIDDICQPDDTPTAMERDIKKFKAEWFRRNYNLEEFFIVASGTSYSTFDILSYLKRELGFLKSANCSFEFVKVGTSDYLVKNGVSVFITVPALDEKDESVFPKIRSTNTLRNMRNEDYVTFMAMEQQTPLPPDNAPFHYDKLRQYETLPNVNETGRMDFCVASLDPKRRGSDYLSMPIFFEAEDSENPNQTVFYLVDWLYDNRPMKDCIPLIVSKIIQHKITRLFAERNTEECIAEIITDKLAQKGYTNCVVEEIYSTEPKYKRIMMAEGDIKSRLIFPKLNMYSPISDVGKAMLCVYNYTYKGKVSFDDAPDSLALFVKKFVSYLIKDYATIECFSR